MKIRKMFLEHLIKDKKENIIWSECIGKNVSFQYDDVEGVIGIEDYNPKENLLTVNYLDNISYIRTGEFTKCRIGIVIGRVVYGYKINKGDNFNDGKRNITIIDRECRLDNQNKNVRFSKYKCNKCGYENWIREIDILNGRGCPCCCINPKVVVPEINSIWATDRWMCDVGVSEEDAKRYTSRSGKRIVTICPYCNVKKETRVADIYRNKSICCTCGDGRSYPEKFTTSILNQLGISYVIEYTLKSTERYDFYIPLNNTIMEAHGSQHPGTKYHFVNGFSCYGTKARNSQQELENDMYKEQLAKENGIRKLYCDRLF